jgi:sigma-E factor negative regulatory protein RseB
MTVPRGHGFRTGRASLRAVSGCASLYALLMALAVVAVAPAAMAEDATGWLARTAAAAQKQNYIGTIVYQHGGRVEMSRLVHLNDQGSEFEKLVNLEGPAREVIRMNGEVRCYYPDAKVIRVEPRTFRNAFPSLSLQQQAALTDFYSFRMAERGRVAGIETQAWVFEPKDGLRYGHKFWADPVSGLLVKARIVDERNEIIEQFAFTEIAIGVKVDREMVTPTWGVAPPDWKVRQSGLGESETKDTGWTVTRVPPGFVKIVDRYRRLHGTQQVAHLVYSDGLVAVSVFIEPIGAASHPIGVTRQGGVNVVIRQQDDNLVTVLGEVPVATVRQIAHSVERR